MKWGGGSAGEMQGKQDVGGWSRRDLHGWRGNDGVEKAKKGKLK